MKSDVKTNRVRQEAGKNLQNLTPSLTVGVRQGFSYIFTEKKMLLCVLCG